MNDNQKTITFIIVGAIALLVGFAPWRSTAIGPTAEDEQGQKLFDSFENALSASSLEVIEFNEDNSTIKPFKVAQVDGVWSIPSHQNYPADAKEHLASAATALIGIEKLGVAGNSPGEHEVFGVIEPDAGKLKAGTTGVGERVIMKDAKDNTLADLIIGKEVKDQPGVRYVRVTGKDPVYRVKIATDKFSTKFEDWIEKDLLKLNTFDIREIDLNDYTLRQVEDEGGAPALGQAKASEIKLKYDDSKSTWSLEDMVTFSKGKPTSTKLAEGEELNTEKLNELRTALDDLKIVDVERKPKGLGGDLSIDSEVIADRQALNQLAMSLASRGFMPVALADKKFSLLSTDGEVICKLKDGVDYIVRFGQVAASGDSGKKPGEKTGLDRYVMITAQLDKSAIPEPELEPLPSDEAKEEKEKVEEPKTTKDAKANGPKKDEKKPAEKKPNAKKAEEKKPEEKKVEEQKPETSPEEDAAKKAALEEKRAQVEKANQRKQDEYDEKVKKAQEKVNELNERFANWYYVISDDEYKKVHLTRADVVKKKEVKAGEGDSVGDFKELEPGLKKK